MPFEISESINSLSATFLGAPFVRTVLGSSIYMSIVLVLALILIAAVVVGLEMTFTDVAKLAAYGFILSIVAVFLHDKIIMEEMKGAGESKHLAGLFADGKVIGGNSAASEATAVVPVNINVDFTK